MDEDGDVVTIQAKPATLVSELFEQYSVQESVSLLLSQIIFHYSQQDGEPLHYSCGNTLIYCEIVSGDIIYVKRKLYDTEKLDKIQIPKVNKHPPESFINQMIWTNESIGSSKSQGAIVDVSHTESGTVWIVEMQEGCKKRIQCTEEDIAEGMRLYYTANDGVGRDFTRYLIHIMRKQKADLEHLVSQLKRQKNEYNDLLSLLKLEQEITRTMEFNLHIEPWTSTEISISIAQSMKSLKDYLQGSIKSLQSKRTKVSKSTKELGEVVYVSNREGIPERGKVKSCKEYEDIDGYGPRRTYSILLDRGELLDVDDYQVIPDEDYLLSKHKKESDWKKVKHVCDKESK